MRLSARWKQILESDKAALGILFLLAFALRLIRLFSLDLNFDEVILLFQAEHSFREIWNLCKLDNFPPLYPWIVKIWVGFNHSVGWYRVLGALMGSLTPPAAYILGKEILNKRLGWMLGLAVALSTSLIFYSQFVRMFNIQPFFVILSIYWFLKALQGDSILYWSLTALANLLGFYVYIFMVFIVMGECLVCLIYNKFTIRRYFRPLLTHIFFGFGLLAWLVPLLQRYRQVKEGFWVPPLSRIEYVQSVFFFGTGSDFRNSYALAVLLNMPFVLGFIIALYQSFKQWKLRSVVIIFLCVILVLSSTALFGQSFFFSRYLLFVTPLYLLIAISGWYYLPSIKLRNFGLIFAVFSLIASLGYYYVDYYQLHNYYSFVRPLPEAEPGEGHNFSTLLRDVADRMKPRDAIIHYSDPSSRICTFYAALFYHHHRYSEHLYSKSEITQYNGKQYLQPGDWIKSLHDLDPLPVGIWIITLTDPKLFSDPLVLAGLKPPLWISRENLPVELKQAGYDLVNSIQMGKVYALYYRLMSTNLQ